MLSFGFRIFCLYRGFCHRTGSDLLLFLFDHLLKILNVHTFDRLALAVSGKVGFP